MAAAVIFSAVSCAKEDISSSIGGGEVEVTFTANLADMGTRAIGDGTSANQVYLAVYETGKTKPLPVINPKTPNLVQGKKATISVVLLRDKVYDLVFWAQSNEATCYTPNWDGRTLTVNYDDAVAQDETRDAFFLVKNGFKAGEDDTTFELRRPFAQLNVGLSADDVENIKKNGVNVYTLQAAVTVKDVFSTLKLTADSVDEDGKQFIEAEDKTAATFDMAAKPTEALVVSGKEYNYLSMNYLLANQNVEVNYTFYDGTTEYFRNYHAVPLKYNYRTNIIGNILSAEYDFNVIIVPGFNEPDYKYDVTPWDGKSVSEPAYDEDTKTYTVNNGAELAWLAGVVNGTISRAEADPLQGVTIVLGADIDLANKHWTPIGYWETFDGVFDGNGHAVKNIKHHGTEEDCYVGLFGYLKNATIKNLIVENVDIKLVGNDSWAGGHIGAIAGRADGKVVLENITIQGLVKIEGDLSKAGAGRIGAVIGGNQGAQNLTLSNIEVNVGEGSFVKGSSSIGGVAGQLQGVATFENVVSNINVSANEFAAGGIIGLAPNQCSFNKCTSTGNVSVLAPSKDSNAYRVGGIAGSWGDNTTYPLSLVECAYSGELSAVTTIHDCAGFVGRGYAQAVDAKVVVNGVEYVYKGNGVYFVEGVYLVTNIVALQALLDGANGNVTIKLGTNLVGDVTVVQKPDTKIVIEGDNHNYNGVITVDGKSGTFLTAGLTINDVNFNGETISADACIRLGNGDNATRYTCNVTVNNCTFDVPGAVGVKSYTGGDKNLQILKSTATDKAHSLLQAAGIEPILIKDCKIYSKNGMNFNNSTNVTIDNCEANVKGYAVRFGAGSTADNNAEAYTITKSSLKSACEDGDAVIILRGTAAKATLTLENTALEGDIQIANNAKDAKVIIGGVSVISSAEALQSALANAKAGDTLTLAPAIIEGTFKPVVENLIIKSANENSKATIKGRVNIDGYGSGIKFENIKFDINDASKHKKTFSGEPYQYPGIVVIYSAATTFEGCEFKCSLSQGVCGINGGQHSDSSDKLTINNCSFAGDFYAIRARTLFSVTNSIFDIYTDAGILAAVWTWGNGNSGANSVTFTGNTNVNENKVYSVQMTAGSHMYDYITINVQGNNNFMSLGDGVKTSKFNGTHTFADGSETF